LWIGNKFQVRQSHMRVKAKVSEEEWKEERKSQERLRELYKKEEEKIISRVKNITDLHDLREIISELGDDFEWQESTSRWLKESGPFEFACLNMRVPGLEPHKERYIFWGIMAFSAAPVAKFDHLGDLERILFELDKKKGEVRAFSTVVHGFLNQYWEKIGKFTDINTALISDDIKIEFEPGDHSISVFKKKPRIRVLGVFIPDLFSMLRRIFSDNVAKMKYRIIEIPTVPHQDFERILEIPFYEYVQKVIEIDGFIQKEWKREPIRSKIPKLLKRFIGIKHPLDSHDYLLFLYHLLWRIPVNEHEKYLKKLQKILEKRRDLEVDFGHHLKELIEKHQALMERTEYLSWQSFKKSEKFKEKLDKEYLKDLNAVAAESIPVSIDKIFRKTLEDTGYPEKSTWLKKIMRLGGWAIGHSYRIAWLVLSRFEWLRDRVLKRLENVKLPLPGGSEDSESEGGKKLALKTV